MTMAAMPIVRQGHRMVLIPDTKYKEIGGNAPDEIVDKAASFTADNTASSTPDRRERICVLGSKAALLV